MARAALIALTRVVRSENKARRRGAVLDAELWENSLEIFADCPGLQAEDFRDLRVRLPAGDPREHFDLALGEKAARIAQCIGLRSLLQKEADRFRFTTNYLKAKLPSRPVEDEPGWPARRSGFIEPAGQHLGKAVRRGKGKILQPPMGTCRGELNAPIGRNNEEGLLGAVSLSGAFDRSRGHHGFAVNYGFHEAKFGDFSDFTGSPSSGRV